MQMVRLVKNDDDRYSIRNRMVILKSNTRKMSEKYPRTKYISHSREHKGETLAVLGVTWEYEGVTWEY